MDPNLHALMEMLAVGGTLMIAFATWASLCPSKDMLGTRLGTGTIVFIILIYLSRAVEEIVIAPDFSPLIFGACLLMVAVYTGVLLGPRRP